MSQYSKETDERLRFLWSQRERASTQEWNELYHLVVSILGHLRWKIVINLEQTGGFVRGELVEHFFQDKVLLSSSTTDCHHAGALRAFYHKYLLSLLEQEKRRRERFISTSSMAGADAEYNWIENQPDTHNAQTLEDELNEVDLSVQSVVKAAGDWLVGQPEWVPIYLALHYCPDKGQSEALVHLAERMGIRSYHYKAQNLGISWKKTDSPGDFHKTLLGKWVCSLGIELADENRAALQVIFEILCRQSLSWVETHLTIRKNNEQEY